MKKHILEKFGKRSKCCNVPMDIIVNLKKIKTYPGFETIGETFVCLKCGKKEIGNNENK